MSLSGISRGVNQSSDPVFQAVTWFRAEDKSPTVQLIRKIAALFAACLLSLTIVGIYFVIKGSIIWMQETKRVNEAAKQLVVVTKTEELAKQLAAARRSAEETKQLAAAKRSDQRDKQLTSTTAVKKNEERARQTSTSMVGASFTRVEKKSGTIDHSSPSAASSSPISQKDQNGFPVPFESLKKMNLCQPEDFQAIIDKANTALINPKKGPIIPSEYVQLEKGWAGSKEPLQQLYDEAKIIAHNMALKELGSLVSNRSDYQKCFYPFLCMLLDYLRKHKQFPSDIHAWAASGL